MDKISRQKIFGFRFISDNNFDLITNRIMNTKDYGVESGLYPFLITPNVDQIVKFPDPRLKSLKKFYENSAYILPDGQPIVWCSKILHKSLKSRLAGSDFFPQIWKSIKTQNRKVVLVVPSLNVAKKLENEYSYCKCYVPPYFDTEEEQYEDIKNHIIEIIKSFKPDFLFVGLGFPKQERLAKDIYITIFDYELKMPFTFLLGASFEFYTGETKRAPLWMQKAGLEWFYRFLQEPKRMFKRYFIDDVKFIFLVYKEIKSQKGSME